MDNRSVKSWLRIPGPITVASLAIAYGLAYTLDASFQRLREYAGTTFQSRPAILISILIPPVVVAGILALAWLALRFLPRSRFAAITFLICGLFVVGEYLSLFGPFPMWLRSTIIGQFRFAMMDFGVQSSTYYLGSACVVIGIAALKRSGDKSRDPPPGR